MDLGAMFLLRKQAAVRHAFAGLIWAAIFTPPGLLAQDCLECHDDTELTTVDEFDNEISLYVNPEIYSASVHGDFSCVDCHIDVEEIPHAENLEPVDCGNCHDDAAAENAKSIHGKARQQGAIDAANCADCHGKHNILAVSDPGSKVYPLNLAATCAVCHSDPQITKKYHIPVSDPLAAYKKSVHGIALMTENNFAAATCVSCHGAHNIQPMSNQDSPINWQRVAETCGQCHDDVYKQYVVSVHGVAVRNGVRDAPVCTDCHGEHAVKSPTDPESSVHPLRVSSETCERCHGSELITARYAIPSARVSTYEDSYHGLAVKGGSLAAANCASCHGIHNILPSSDPRSLVNPANLQKTCGSCHSDLSENILKGAVHLTSSTTPGRIVQIVKNVYIFFIVLVIGGMLVHNSADFVKRSKRILRHREEE